jgi:hypothetical protein
MTWLTERAAQVVDEAIYNFLYGDEDEKRRQFKEHFMLAAERAIREAIEAAALLAEDYISGEDGIRAYIRRELLGDHDVG